MQFVGVSAQPWLGNTPMVLPQVWSLDQCWPVLDFYEEPLVP
jgi:hypothetical protein